MKKILPVIILCFISRIGTSQNKDIEVTGSVVDDTNNPIKDLPVIVEYIYERPHQDTVFTDVNGQFRYVVKNKTTLEDNFPINVYTSDCENKPIKYRVKSVKDHISFKSCRKSRNKR